MSVGIWVKNKNIVLEMNEEMFDLERMKFWLNHFVHRIWNQSYVGVLHRHFNYVWKNTSTFYIFRHPPKAFKATKPSKNPLFIFVWTHSN
jgi:hypothetical protein